MRPCRRCGKAKPLARFEEYRPGYWRRVCRECVQAARRQRERENPALVRRASAAAARARAHNREKLNARQRILRQRPDQRERRRQWARENADRINAQNRGYRAANRARARELARTNMRHRRLGYDAALCAWSDVLARDPCAYCGRPSTGIDHIEPIDDGGANAVENFAGACIDCNRRKRTTPLLHFLLGSAA